MGRAALDAQADSSLQHSVLVESIAGAETLKAARAEGQMLGRWRRYSAMSAATQERMRRLTAVAVNLASVSQQLISVGLLIGGFYQFNEGDMTMGAIIAIIMLAGPLAPADRPARLPLHPRQAGVRDARFAAADDGGRPTSGRSRCAASCPRSAPATSSSTTCRFRYPDAGARFARRGLNLKIEPGRADRDHRPRRLGQVDARPGAVRPLRADRRRRCWSTASTAASTTRTSCARRSASSARTPKLFSGTVRDNLMLGAAEADDAPADRRGRPLGRRHLPVARRRRLRPAGRRARLAPVGRPARRCWSSPARWSARASCCSSTSRPGRWTPRPSSISSSI